MKRSINRYYAPEFCVDFLKFCWDPERKTLNIRYAALFTSQTRWGRRIGSFTPTSLLVLVGCFVKGYGGGKEYLPNRLILHIIYNK
jgi:hypothetical protein